MFSCYSSGWARGPPWFPSLKSGLGFYHLRYVWGSAGVSAIRKAIVTLCIFKLLCQASVPSFSLQNLSFSFFLVKAKCQIPRPNTFRFERKRGGMLGTHVWSILFMSIFYYITCTFISLFRELSPISLDSVPRDLCSYKPVFMA